MKIIARGAEAVIYLDNNVLIKERIKKSYRLDEIDLRLRKTRTRSESKLLMKADINLPKIFKFSDKDMKIEMEFIDGELLRDVLDKLEYEKRVEICKNIGGQIKSLHDKKIIHGDLTTSNMILKDNKVYFIDFGLGFFSGKNEDKAVDLHLLKQALESKHYKIFEECFGAVIEGYNPDKEILEKFKKVESRGRYKRKEDKLS